jgi:pimeloyl-ACP methyl ester carboxylesterase
MQVTIIPDNGKLSGTMLIADTTTITPVVLIIAGSGPTDRNGNNSMMINNSLQYLAEGLTEMGISSLRFDKRGIGESVEAGLKEEDLRFETYINDVISWVSFLKNEKKFSDVIICGHSEGALIGMIASKLSSVDKYISLAGAGLPAADIIRNQLENQPPMVKDAAFPILDSLENGLNVQNVPFFLSSLFRPTIQDYVISWFKYNPVNEINELSIPVMIIQGGTDIQVSIDNAELLQKIKPNATYLFIEQMNHILKKAPAERTANIATYSDPKLPVVPELIHGIAAFVSKS